MCNEKRLEILEELLNDLNNTCDSSDKYYQIEALSLAIQDLKNCKSYVRFSMQDVKDSDECIWVTDSDFKQVFAGTLYYMCPSHPRKFQTIMTKLIEIIDRTFTEGIAQTKMISVAYKDVHDWVKTVVHSIPEILELNLTSNEYNAGVTLETREDADSIVITSRYSVIPEGEDFVDINALIQNITYNICRDAADN